MTSISEIELSIKIASELDCKQQCSHEAFLQQPMFIGDADAGKLKRFDPELAKALTTGGVKVVNATLEDFDLIGRKLDEIAAQTGVTDLADDDSLEKHAIARRLSYRLLAEHGSARKIQIRICSRVFGHKLTLY